MPHLISGDRVIGQFGVPWRGVNQIVRADMLQPDALRAANNVFPRQGVLRLRPGYQQFHSQTFTGTPTGIYPYLVGASDPRPVLATTSRIYVYESGAWADKTGTLQTATTSQLARFTSISLGTPTLNYVIHSNGKDTPTKWTGSSTFSSVLGAPPLWSDLCTLEDHVIGIIPPYRVQWGNLRAIDKWPSLNTKQAAETVDAVVAIRPLGQGSLGVLYKERSLWGVSYTGSKTEAGAFKFEFLGFFDGPASPAAVVDVDGAHIYMTPTGRIAFFSGSSHKWIADGLWPVIQADLDTSYAARIWGLYDPQHHEVHFFYPSLARGSLMRGWVGITLPKPDENVTSFGSFPGLLTDDLTAGATIRLTDKVDFLLVAGKTPKSYKFTTDVKTDDGTAFPFSWQTGLVMAPGIDPFRLEAVETFAERGNGYGQLGLRMLTSWTLFNDGEMEDLPQSVELGNLDEPRKAGRGVNIQGRFFGLHYSGFDSSAVTLRWKGATLVALRKAP